MGTKFLMYNNKLWKAHKVFEYTGHDEGFTLEPDTYLFVANGARGGQYLNDGNEFISWGGTSYGIIDLDHTQTFYAVVGGNGADTKTVSKWHMEELEKYNGKGGFNGGGDGGIIVNFDLANAYGYPAGTGGGGASDVRLAPYDAYTTIDHEFVVPDEYIPYEYLESTYEDCQYVLTNYFHKENTKIICDFYAPSNLPNMHEFATVFGNSFNPFDLHVRVDDKNLAYYERSDTLYLNVEYRHRYPDFPYNKRVRVEIFNKECNVYNEDGTKKLLSMIGDGTPGGSKPSSYATQSLCIFGRGEVTSDYDKRSAFTGKIYSMTIYEDDELKHHFIPAKSLEQKKTVLNNSDFFEYKEDPIQPYYHLRSRAYQIRDYLGSCRLYITEGTVSGDAVLITEGYGDSHVRWVRNGETFKFEDPRNTIFHIVIYQSTWDGIMRITVEETPTGMYDVVTRRFCENQSITGQFILGPEASRNITVHQKLSSLYSRIFVAGGGGGTGAQYGRPYTRVNVQDYTSFGGGATSGWMTQWPTVEGDKSYKSASQNTGYAFGRGCIAKNTKKSTSGWFWNDRECAGGGGGWYGGYAQLGPPYASPPVIEGREKEAFLSTNGSGGSSYALTATSYKPEHYMDGFTDIMESLYFHDVMLLPYQAFDGPSIEIYKEANVVPNQGDVIIVPYTGDYQKYQLIPATYTFKCYGGDGGCAYTNLLAGRGGYAEGKCETTNEPLVFSVGSSGYLMGLDCDSATHDVIFNNKPVFNGTTNGYSGMIEGARTGGGSTDIRTREDVSDIPMPTGYTICEFIRSDGTQHIKTGYIPKATTNIECVCKIITNKQRSYEALFGTRYSSTTRAFVFFTRFNGSNIPCFACGNVERKGSDLRYEEKILVTVNDNVLSWYDTEGTLISSITGNARVNNDKELYIFDLNNNGSPDNSRSVAELYYMKIFEDGELVHHYVPFMSKSDSSDSGLYDVCTGTFLRKGSGSNFLCGVSLYSRIIVAGGAGGCGVEYWEDALTSQPNTFEYTGGAGGGLTGDTAKDTPTGGGGKQNGVPNGSNASFGHGGLGTNNSDESYVYYPGHGGSGWFGGSGASQGSPGGSGGSGYVLTQSSYKPTGYIPGSNYYMTNTYIGSGTGANPIRGMTRIEIYPDSLSAIYVIAKDNDSYKAYNVDTDEWEPVSIEELGIPEFNMYGVFTNKVKTDTGLLFPYKLYLYDPFNLGLSGVRTHVVPNTQHLSMYEKTLADVLTDSIDYDTDENVTINMYYDITGVAENRKINIDITLDMLDTPTIVSTIYTIQFDIQKKQTQYYYPEPLPGPTGPYVGLQVGTAKFVPTRYKVYTDGYMPDGTTAIESVDSSVSCVHNRNVYTAALLNNSVIRILRFNIIENKAYLVRDDIPKSILPQFGGSILVDDANVYLVSSAMSNKKIRICVIPLDDSLPYQTYSPDETGSSREYYTNAYGTAFWYSPTEIIVAQGAGFQIFNTNTREYTKKNTSVIDTFRTFAVGKYSILVIRDKGNITTPDVFDRTTFSKVTYSGPSMVSSYKQITYDEGTNSFYIAQKGHIYIFEDTPTHQFTLKQEILPPFTNFDTNSVNYADGILYVTFSERNVPYMCAYNFKSNQWFDIATPYETWVVTDSRLYRPACFNSYFFMGNKKLFVTNANIITKYKLGEPGNVLLIRTNTEVENTMTYDERFITVSDIGIQFHTGYIDKKVNAYDEENHIYVSTNITGGEYRKLIGLEFDLQ